jgi:hypothetical protein
MQHCVFSHVFARLRTFGLTGYTLFALIPIRRLIHSGCVFLLYTGAQTGYAEYACGLGYAVHSVLRMVPALRFARGSSPSVDDRLRVCRFSGDLPSASIAVTHVCGKN